VTRLYLDDVRNPPEDGGEPWTVCRTVEEAKRVLLQGVDEASLDHDMGQCVFCRRDTGPDHCPHVATGLELVAWMVVHGAWPRLKPRVHSANRLYGPLMAEMIERHWRPR
jgi:hypothetical protein